jgi:Uma2 family endonuclease
MSIAAHLLTAEEFRLLPEPADGGKQELVRGEVITMPSPGFRHGVVQLNSGSILRAYSKTTQRGRVTVESGILTQRGPDTVRGPDVAFWSIERLPFDLEPEAYPEVAADLCVEILSPGNRRSKMLEKLREYFACGVRMVWVIDPEDKTITVYRTPERGQLLHCGATLEGEDVLPGFSCPVSEFFA